MITKSEFIDARSKSMRWLFAAVLPFFLGLLCVCVLIFPEEVNPEFRLAPPIAVILAFGFVSLAVWLYSKFRRYGTQLECPSCKNWLPSDGDYVLTVGTCRRCDTPIIQGHGSKSFDPSQIEKAKVLKPSWAKSQIVFLVLILVILLLFAFATLTILMLSLAFGSLIYGVIAIWRPMWIIDKYDTPEKAERERGNLKWSGYKMILAAIMVIVILFLTKSGGK